MSRDPTPYAQMRPVAQVGEGIDVTEPVAGFYRTRLAGRSIAVGVRLFFGPPYDPITGEVLDRSWRWLCDVNGEPFGYFERVWPVCAGDQITEAEYENYCARQRWARTQAPDSAYAEPGRRYDPLSAKEAMPF